uniref:Calponin-homology (CH) domain-containing protein n=1 Tax=Mesocestoides corti TaxID=53468 RepID=A0A5K3F5F9_MESCO
MCATKCPKKVTPAASRGGHLQPPQQQIHQRSLLTKRNFLQNPSTPQKYCISQLDLLRPVKTKAETISLYTEWANHYLEKAGYACFVRDLQNDLRDGKMLISLTHAVVNEKVVLDGSTSSPREVVEACLKVLEEIGVDMQDVTADGIVNGRLKCILGLFFNLSKFKQKMRQCSQPKLSYRLPLVHTHHHHHKQGNAASVAPASLDSPDGDKRYVTPPSSVQSSVLQPYNDLQPSRPVSDHLVMNKSTDSTSRLPVFGMKKGKNCSILPTTGATDPRGPSRKESTGEESTISSLLCPRVNPPRSIRSQKPVKNLQTQRTHPQDTQGSPIGNQPMLGGDLRCAVSSLPKAGQKPPKSGFSVNGGHATEANGIRRGRPSNLPHFSNDVSSGRYHYLACLNSVQLKTD